MTWKVVHASVTGTSHTECNRNCQDSSSWGIIPSLDGHGYLCCVVSDGAGSAQCGAEGADLACAAAAASIRASLFGIGSLPTEPRSVQQWITDIQRVIAEDACSNGLTPRDYACTVIGAVVGRVSAMFFQIGDGGIVATVGSSAGVVFWPDSGPYANMTFFVTDEDALCHLQTAFLETRVDEIAVFSDGLQRLALEFDRQTPYNPFFEPMFSVLRKTSFDKCEALSRQLAQFLKSTPVNERTDDDKTLLLATRRSES